MYESAENRSVKILFSVRFIVGHYTQNAYIAWIVSVMMLIAEICGKTDFIYYIIYIYICHYFTLIIAIDEQGDVLSE